MKLRWGKKWGKHGPKIGKSHARAGGAKEIAKILWTHIIFFRVDSWMTFKGKTPYGQQKAEKVKKAKKAKFSPIGFRPPKPKPEQRMWKYPLCCVVYMSPCSCVQRVSKAFYWADSTVMRRCCDRGVNMVKLLRSAVFSWQQTDNRVSRTSA